MIIGPCTIFLCLVQTEKRLFSDFSAILYVIIMYKDVWLVYNPVYTCILDTFTISNKELLHTNQPTQLVTACIP